MSSDPQSLSKIFTRLYATFLKSLFYDDIGFEPNIATELDLGTILNEHHAIIDNLEDENISSHERRIFREDEIVGYGMPDRRQLSPVATKRIRDQVDKTLQTVAEIFYANFTPQDDDVRSPKPFSKLPGDLKDQVDNIISMQLEIHTLSNRLTELLGKTRTTRDEFDYELEKLISYTFPAFQASRNASIDLLAAEIEATLQKLNSTRESARQAFYNHQVEQTQTSFQTVSQAISIAYQTLVEEGEALQVETQDLDRQIQEYESLLKLVDGSGSGYQQLVKDWVKTNRETDECMKDLRRLGWTGD